MQEYPPEVQRYVEQIVFHMLDSLRTSQQVEERYHELSRKAKGATTKRLHELSEIAAQHILTHVDDIGALADLDDDTLVREALMRALADE